MRKIKDAIKIILNNALYSYDLLMSNLIKKCHASATIKCLLLSEWQSYTHEQQWHAFYVYRKRLKKEVNLIFHHDRTRNFLKEKKNKIARFDIIFVQTFFKKNPQETMEIFRQVNAAKGKAKIICVDSADDLCIRFPGVFPYVDLYVKKNIFRDMRLYSKRYIGRTNLTDYLARNNLVTFADESEPLPSGYFEKIALGWNIGLEKPVLELYRKSKNQKCTKTIDIVFRAPIKPVNEIYWASAFRAGIADKLKEIKSSFNVVASSEPLRQKEYWKELLKSKICVSPFGYGEVCWRDFEAIISGCLLIKPNTEHVRTEPNIFVRGETYVPVNWDYSDLRDKCVYYLTHESERQRIVNNAYRIYRDYLDNNKFLDKVKEIITRL